MRVHIVEAERTEARPPVEMPPNYPEATPNPTWYYPHRLGESYELDAIERLIDETQRPSCDASGLVHYRGTTIPFASAARVHPAFIERLSRLENVIAEIARVHFGRAPVQLMHHGAYNCRSARGRSYRLSEHALGNAIDLTALRFPRLQRREADPRYRELPRHLQRPFIIDVGRHWKPGSPRETLQSEFLHALLERLRREPDIVRGILGPPHKRHRQHVHLDAAPWRYCYFHYGDTEFVPPPPQDP